MVIKNNKQDIVVVLEQSSVFRLAHYQASAMKGLQFKT